MVVEVDGAGSLEGGGEDVVVDPPGALSLALSDIHQPPLSLIQ